MAKDLDPKNTVPELQVERKATDIFVGNKVFPEASAVFTSRSQTLTEVLKTACIVLDTNALLVPYGIGAQTLAQVEATYKGLLNEKRLVIPAQVAREFARNRVTKLSELHQRLSRRRSQLQPFQQGNYPLLEAVPEYENLRETEDQLDALISKYRQQLGSVIDHLAAWEWNDPVSVLYNRLFPAEAVFDTSKPLEDIRQEHVRRFSSKIPPGYKDNAKDDEGIGDLLIWMTILEVGSHRKTSVIFVSGEEKSDWWHRSENQHLYPRYELVDEFRRASTGHSFHIIKFSRLLELFGASTTVVAEIRKEEEIASPEIPLTRHSAAHLRSIEAERAVASWLMQLGFEVSPATSPYRYDYVVEGNGTVFAVDVMSIRNPLVLQQRFKELSRRQREASDLPLTVVAVGESVDDVHRAETVWSKLDPPFRLCAGILTASGSFTALRPL
ncbi:MAG: DUF4935 domain-containing protein [Bryobacterales bacterium]|nr:DUF4935 domain-containing protein [Bryobacterales bacterium]